MKHFFLALLSVAVIACSDDDDASTAVVDQTISFTITPEDDNGQQFTAYAYRNLLLNINSEEREDFTLTIKEQDDKEIRYLAVNNKPYELGDPIPINVLRESIQIGALFYEDRELNLSFELKPLIILTPEDENPIVVDVKFEILNPPFEVFTEFEAIGDDDILFGSSSTVLLLTHLPNFPPDDPEFKYKVTKKSGDYTLAFENSFFEYTTVESGVIPLGEEGHDSLDIRDDKFYVYYTFQLTPNQNIDQTLELDIELSDRYGQSKTVSVSVIVNKNLNVD